MDEIVHELILHSGTGHHYYFFPVFTEDKELLRGTSLELLFPPNLSDRKSQKEIANFATKYTQWIAGGEDFEWIKLRFSNEDFAVSRAEFKSSKAIVKGVWICIETNIGHKDSGVHYDTKDCPSEEKIESSKSEKTKYVAATTSELPDVEAGEVELIDLSAAFCEFELFKKAAGLPSFKLQITWDKYASQEKIPVRLLVDYGNSRTVAATLDNAPNAMDDHQLSMITRPVDLNTEYQDASDFFNEGVSLSYDDFISDSWMVLRTPLFEPSHFDYLSNCTSVVRQFYDKPNLMGKLLRKKDKLVSSSIEYYQPYMFRELSPSAIGRPAYDIVGSVKVNDHLNYYLSAPKRYCWDTDLVGAGGESSWYMINTDKAISIATKSLSGEFLKYLPLDFGKRGLDYPIGKGKNPAIAPPEEQAMCSQMLCKYPKADAMIWSALRIIELTHRQINAQSYRQARSIGTRRLSEVVLSYPSGWTFAEKQSFEDAWKTAANMFHFSRFEEGVEAIDVRLGLDEAVASQLPIVFADITHLGGSVQRWLELYGKKRDGEYVCDVLTIDIGGGTVDTSVVEYSNGSVNKDYDSPPVLHPKVLLTDSSYHAGDKLVKDLTENILIPELCKSLDVSERQIFYDYLRGSDQQPVDTSDRAVLNRTIFLPMVLGWLQRLSEVSINGGVISLSAEDAKCHPDKIRGLNRDLKACGLSNDIWPNGAKFDINVSHIRDIVIRWLNPLVSSSEKYLGGMGCDLVVVTGKPSEIETVKHELRDRLPIDPTKIIFAKGFFGGMHLPLSTGVGEEKSIADAKLVTLTGSIIREATLPDRYATLPSENAGTDEKSVSGALLQDWQIHPTTYDESFARNYWFIQLSGSSLTNRGMTKCILEPTSDRFDYVHTSNSAAHFSRSKFRNGITERIYELRILTKKTYHIIEPLTFGIARHLDVQKGQKLATEKLELCSVSGQYSDGTEASIEHWQLRVKTSDGEHWMDKPKFGRVSSELSDERIENYKE